MLDFAVRLTTGAYRIIPEDLARLRSAGFSDVGILQITLIASWFNYINRVADALGSRGQNENPLGSWADISECRRQHSRRGCGRRSF